MKPTPTKAPLSSGIIASIVIITLVLIYAIIAFVRSPKAVASNSQIDLPQNSATNIAWPSYGQAAVGADGFGVLATNGAQTAHPIASIAKLILAEAVLNKYPISSGNGPIITITQSDVDLYNTALAQSGSIVPVNFGEQLSEYQMLQGLLIASGDNIADTLANWAYGSTDNYVAYANKMVSDMNLKDTHIADASGLSPQTVSSAHDLVILGEKSLSYPTISDIVSQQKVTLPVAGTLKNYDSLLGQDGVIGIKTGNTTEAGGCFLFAVKNPSDTNGATVIGAILGAKNLISVLYNSQTFIQANMNNFRTIHVLQAGQTVGTYNTPWGQKINIVAQKDLTMFTVNGEKVNTNISLQSIKSGNKGDQVGTISATTSNGSVTIPVTLDSNLTKPTFGWKLLHPFAK